MTLEKKAFKLLSLSILVIIQACGPLKEVTTNELTGHIKYLSSDSLRGRNTGSEGDLLAAQYIRKELLSAGLVPLNDNGFQEFIVTTSLLAGSANKMIAGNDTLILNKDFVPFSFSSNATVKEEVLFAGYGFNINEEKNKWDDYSGIDVNGKWVMMLRADPETDNPESIFIQSSNDRTKALNAKDMGAAGVLMVSGAAFDPQDTFESMNATDISLGIPVMRITRKSADRILLKSGITIALLEKKLNETRKPSSFATGTILEGSSEVIREEGKTRNVVMLLEGEDDVLKNEYVIVGAHFDHLGMGGTGSSMAPDTIAVHPGADDNASGTAMMMEVAEKLSGTKGSHPRSIIFIGFSGEEKGVLGSKFFVNNPPVDLKKVNAMVNLDMVGRLQESDILQVSGIGTADTLRGLVTSLNDTSLLKLAFSEAGYGPSDHASFYSKNIPVLFFTTGAHTDYHKPADTFDKINYNGMVNVSSLVYNVISSLATYPERLAFREAGPKEVQGRPMRRKSITLGIMPDFNGNEKGGLRADIVTPGKPASLGGMKNGDVITSINGKAVSNIYDYMSRMGQLKAGERITVEIIRDGDKLTLLIQL